MDLQEIIGAFFGIFIIILLALLFIYLNAFFQKKK
jgi:cadmium resistance protein CadD (predicted permease)